MARIRKLIGKKCFLSPIDLADAEIYTRWLNDMEVIRNLTVSNSVINVESEREFLTALSKEHNYGIVDLETDKLIGNCGFSMINNFDKTAEIGVFIGDKSFWHKGYGSEAIGLLLDYGYMYLNLHNVLLRVFDFNKNALETYTKIGFKVIGTRRECQPRERRMIDVIYMDILPQDFYKK